MKEIELVKQKADELGYTTTKMQYVLMSKIMAESSVDVSPEDCKRVCNLQRHCRAILGKDDVSLALELKWRKGEAYRQTENEWNTMFERNALDV